MSSKHFFIEHFADVASNNILFEAILWNCILTRHSFGATFRSCIPTLSLWGNSTELNSQNISFEAILQNCILKIFSSWQLSGVVLYKSLFDAILRNYILKIFIVRQLSGVVSPHFVLKQLYGVVFPQYFFQDKSTELYSQNISFEAILRNCILKIFSLGELCRVVFPHFPLRQLCIIVFSKHFIWGNSPKLYSHTFLLGNFA